MTTPENQNPYSQPGQPPQQPGQPQQPAQPPQSGQQLPQPGQQLPQPGQPPQHSAQTQQPAQPGQPAQYPAQAPYYAQQYPPGAYPQGPAPYAAGQTKKSNGRIAAVVFAVLAVLALLAGTVLFFVSQSRDGGTGKDMSEESVQKLFSGGKLDRCDWPDAFSEEAGWHDLSGGTVLCEGWYETEQGDVSVAISFTGSAAFRVEPVAEDANLPGWNETPGGGEEVPYCQMTSDLPELENVELSSFGPCGTLRPMAQNLNNLVLTYRGGSDPELTHTPPRPERMSLKAWEYAESEEIAADFGVPVDMSLDGLEGGYIRPTDITVKGGSMADYEMCVEADLFYGSRADDSDEDVELPAFDIIYPNDGYQPLDEVTDEVPSYKEGKTEKLVSCGNFLPEMRNSDVLLRAYAADELIAAWRFRVDDKDGSQPIL